ncbi:MAG: Bug family tripartite tricarboxylate transporter substrate binding protein [Burkholderiaceae bacterium]
MAPAFASASSKFPTRSVEMIVPYPPGGSADFVTRLIAEQLSKGWGVPVIVQNRPGATGQIGFSAIAKAKPDGYTFGLVPAAFMHLAAINPSLPFDVLKDFSFITRVSEMPFVMTASSKFAPRSITEVVEFAKKSPGELSYGSFGAGSSAHVLGVMLTRETGIQATHVPFQGSAQMVPMEIAGEIKVSFDLIVSKLAFIKSGQLTPLFVTSAARNPSLPDTPTAAEVGLPNLEFETWFGFMGPKGIPPETMRALNAAIVAAARQPEVRAKLRQQGMAVRTETPEEFTRFVTDYKERIRRVVQENAGESK